MDAFDPPDPFRHAKYWQLKSFQLQAKREEEIATTHSNSMSLAQFQSLSADSPLKLKVNGITHAIPLSTLANIDASLADKLKALSVSKDPDNSYVFAPDHQASLEILLYWLHLHALPPPPADQTPASDQAHTFVHAWKLGATLALPTFQDAIMLQLLRLALRGNFAMAAVTDLIEHLAPGDSVLQKYLVEEMVWLEGWGRTGLEKERITELMAVRGFSDAFAKAYAYLLRGGPYFCRLPGCGGDEAGMEEEGRWKEFMVGEGPKEHWVHERRAPSAEEDAGARRRALDLDARPAALVRNER